MAKLLLLKKLNIVLTWEALVSHIKKNDLIKFSNTLNELFVNII